MPEKGKFEPGEKEMIVKGYIDGTYGWRELSRKYNVSVETLKEWLRLYQSHGIMGITPKSNNNSYSSALKLSAVMDYLSGNFTQEQICIKYNITKTNLLKMWIKKYNGHKELKSSHSGGINVMTKARKTTKDEKIEIVAYCIEHGKDYGKAIEKYNVSYQQIYSWVKKYTKSGINGLSDRRGKAKDKDSMTELEKFKAQYRLLQAQLKDKEMENDLLKKVMEIERRRD